MLFNSTDFVLFFPVVVALFFAIPHKYRWVLLLGSSYYFYMCWKMEYVLLIIASTLVDYFCGLRMSRVSTKKERRPFLILSLVSNLGILFGFKYFNFFSDSARELFNAVNLVYEVPVLDVLLPVGISFYTFQTLSYTIDVYRGNTPPERHLGIFALYVAFWPQLVAGPIERSGRLLPQFFKKHRFEYTRVVEGLRLMLWGFFKKVVIADRLAFYVNEVYNSPGVYEGTPVLLASYFFAFQIYCDFSGYSDIAIGSAKVLGYDLMDNFKRPYFSKSIREFWQRWHISLSTWFRDYLYIPLGGNRVFKWRWYYNLFITFLISGLWHGANWTFVVWGALHGVYLVVAIWIEGLSARVRELLHFDKNRTLANMVNVLITFHLVVFAWIFFRANSLDDAVTIIQSLAQFDLNSLGINIYIEKVANNKMELCLSIALVAILLLMQFVSRRTGTLTFISQRNLPVRWAMYVVMILALLFLRPANTGSDFIYFQF